MDQFSNCVASRTRLNTPALASDVWDQRLGCGIDIEHLSWRVMIAAALPPAVFHGCQHVAEAFAMRPLNDIKGGG
jgi:hypothetical protein